MKWKEVKSSNQAKFCNSYNLNFLHKNNMVLGLEKTVLDGKPCYKRTMLKEERLYKWLALQIRKLKMALEKTIVELKPPNIHT